MNLHGVEVALARRGSGDPKGSPILLLASEDGLEAGSAFAAALAGDHALIVPDPPGFGDSPENARITTVDDIAYLWLDLLDALDLKNAVVIGCSLGGWIAAEMATKSCARIGRLILIGATGIKVGGPFERDIADIYMLSGAEVTARTYGSAALAPDFAAMGDAEVARVARNRLATVKYCWEPYMHDPKLKDRLHRISAPTFVLWGARDRIAAPDYGRAYAAAIPGARFELIADAGHLPHLERPDNVVHHVKTFLRSRG